MRVMTNSEPQEGADMQPIILDDPNTKDPADFWLHPCAALAATLGLRISQF